MRKSAEVKLETAGIVWATINVYGEPPSIAATVTARTLAHAITGPVRAPLAGERAQSWTSNEFHSAVVAHFTATEAQDVFDGIANVMPFMDEPHECDYCVRRATRAEPSPFALEIHNDRSLAHWSCDDPECVAKLENDLHESAMDI